MNNKTGFARNTRQEGDLREWTVAVIGSALLHIGLCLIIVLFSGHTRSKPASIRSIDVDLSYVSPPKGIAEAKPVKSNAKKAVKKKAAKAVSETKKTKATGLKKKKTVKKTQKKVVKPKDTINDAIKRLEKDLAKTPERQTKPDSDPLAERLKQLAEETKRESANTSNDDGPVGKPDGTAEKGETAYDTTLEMRYIYNVSMEIRENWAFSEKLAAGQEHLETLVVFEVSRDGEIRGVRITRRSGNDYMDSSATMAIVKSSPVRPFPVGLNKPFVEVKLRFTPKGLN